MSQFKYAVKIEELFEFRDMNPVHTPIEWEMETSQATYVNDSCLYKSKPYREAVGNLLYLVII